MSDDTQPPRFALAHVRPVDQLREVGPGVAASFILHLTALLLILFFFFRATHQADVPLRIVPIDVVVRLGDKTTSPAAPQKAAVPVERAPRSQKQEEANPRPHEGYAPNKTRPLPLDDMDAKLRALSRLRMPARPLPTLDNAGTSDDTASNGAAAGDAMYSLKDYVRMQIERRWNLNFGRLGSRRYTIPLHIVMKKNGIIEKVEIVDHARYVSDAAYHWISLSARNAVILSSPVSLPPGDYDDEMDFTLQFNPRDMLR